MDTNVPVVANQTESPQASPDCQLACIRALERVKDGCCLLVDSRGEIFQEYRDNLRSSGQPGLGDAFFKWIWDHQGNEDHCRRVDIAIHPERGFEIFPTTPDLEGFDPSDRKFVAVALESAQDPPILNAVDSDWWEYRDALNAHRLRIDFLCPDAMTGR